MARNRRELTVEFKGDTGDLTRAANESEKALTGVGHAASGPGGMLSRLTPVIDPINLIGQGLQAATSMAWDFAKAASEDNKSAAQLAGVMRNVTNATKAQIDAADDWIGRLQLQVGIADDELRPAYARLVAATGDIASAQDLLTVALDVAAGTGKDYNSIVDALVKAQNGQLTGLGRLGIATKDEAGNQLTLGQVLDSMREKWGGLAAQVADQDPAAKAQLAWGELQEMLGQVFLPVIAAVTDYFVTKVFPVLQELWRKLKEEVGPIVRDELVPAFRELRDASREIMTALEPLIGKMSALDFVVKLVSGSVRVMAEVLEVGASFVRLWADELKWLVDTATGVIRWLKDAWQGVADFFGHLTDPLRGEWTDFFHWLARLWNSTIGKLSFHIPGTDIGFDAPTFPGGYAASSSAPAPAAITLNLPAGTDGNAIVAQLRTYGARIGGLELGAVTRAALR